MPENNSESYTYERPFEIFKIWKVIALVTKENLKSKTDMKGFTIVLNIYKDRLSFKLKFQFCKRVTTKCWLQFSAKCSTTK